jgi:hypothetical protein
MNSVMSKRRKLWLFLASLVLLALVFAHPWPRYGVWGLLRGESFYRGYPTSYWSSVWSSKSSVVKNWRRWIYDLIGTKERWSPDMNRMFEGDPEATAVLLELLEDDEEWVRRIAVNAILRMEIRRETDEAARQAISAFVPALIQLHQSGTRYDRYRAATALGWIGPEAIAAVPFLESDLKSADRLLKGSAAEAILLIDPHHHGAFTCLLDELALSESSDARFWPIHPLAVYLENRPEVGFARLREHRSEFLLVLRRAADEGSDDIKHLANWMLEQMGPESATPEKDQ